MPAVDPLATVRLLALVADHHATAGFPTLVAGQCSTVGFPTLATDRCAIAGRPALAAYHRATARFLMLLADYCPSVERHATTRRPNLRASPTQVSRPWLPQAPEIFGVLLQGMRLQHGRRKE